ncbi:putative mediator of RNA polymerase II transcription subunit [Clavispora lusitaniae]|uniref:Mediator of RNA polymerase II transcription subunit 11 n=3 Tax=Clavispora lusitaniae TaxID=36911 RepID=C4YBT6_CLAL4|nr:uncharacterized protein CLUG_05664 [Clavispora lusitaniae ATCC 42720]KAF5208525.1 Mediator of RNA polymerase II transcription subunit 11 [Clavispora lusitaniae]EEQ41536.1 hypothetical protein CLUG_05664 [Clavispora lusitaniae ATCC 42720]KAF7580662.1 Mediator complex family protein [Clavispora lusitaniae]OVF09477.1 putative mediator of RNA polymerase II transcription subunit [Clavispora lusitaniae]QFZ30547.1 putative mediator of RNA polymerase II transcription subunit [Clavispora lusitaniae]
MTQRGFIQERLESLNEIDNNVVGLLDRVSKLIDTYMEPSRNTTADISSTKEQFQEEVKEVYSVLSALAISLRKEVKIMDENIGVYDKNDDSIMILPMNVDQKNTTLGKRKLEEELEKLESE